jgi:hypothetical protein
MSFKHETNKVYVVLVHFFKKRAIILTDFIMTFLPISRPESDKKGNGLVRSSNQLEKS